MSALLTLLMPAITELEAAYEKAKNDPEFRRELDSYLREYVGRPTALTFCERLSEEYGPRIYLKREDLAHTGAHKINNAVGQASLAKYMGKTHLIAETGAGQHGERRRLSHVRPSPFPRGNLPGAISICAYRAGRSKGAAEGRYDRLEPLYAGRRRQFQPAGGRP